MSRAHTTAVDSFNSNHLSYDKFRPSFSPIIVDKLLLDMGLGSKAGEDMEYSTDKTILELAAGTGKFTRNLVDSGWTDNLIIVEPSEGMLESFRQNFPMVQSYLGSSYSIPLEDSSVDAILIAQGFHWFSDLDSLKEMRRVLKKGGTLGMIWNFDAPSQSQILREPLPEASILFDVGDENVKSELDLSHESGKHPDRIIQKFFGLHPWSTEIAKYVYTYDTLVPQYRHRGWRELLSTSNDYFTPTLKENFLLYFSCAPEADVYSYWETRSYVTCLDEEEKAKIKRNIEQLCNDYLKDTDKITNDNVTLLKKSMGCHSIMLKTK